MTTATQTYAWHTCRLLPALTAAIPLATCSWHINLAHVRTRPDPARSATSTPHEALRDPGPGFVLFFFSVFLYSPLTQTRFPSHSLTKVLLFMQYFGKSYLMAEMEYGSKVEKLACGLVVCFCFFFVFFTPSLHSSPTLLMFY